MKRVVEKQLLLRSSSVVRALLRGTLFVAVILTSLLFVYDIANNTAFRLRFYIACAGLVYLLVTRLILTKGYVATASWLIIILYEILAASLLTTWGLSSTVGILTACFALLLPSILMTLTKILPVTIITVLILISVFIVHQLNIIRPIIYTPAEASSIYDIIAYVTILGIFALVSWISATQASKSLTRALKAEERLRRQKATLAIQLRDESRRLGQSKQQQIKELYRFAVIGQSASATLHELANHLSVVSLDIERLKDKHKSSIAIKNAEESILYINQMVRKARLQLNNSSDTTMTFSVLEVINQQIHDFKSRSAHKVVTIDLKAPKASSGFYVNGDSLYLEQCVSILLRNAVEACRESVHPRIKIAVKADVKSVRILISDNGPGVPKAVAANLFSPVESTKASGLGIGLYIAHHIIESYFKGRLEYRPSLIGAKFELTLPGANVDLVPRTPTTLGSLSQRETQDAQPGS